MTSINRVDQLVLQLRAQLQRIAKERGGPASRTDAAGLGPLDRIREQGSDRRNGGEFRRQFVRAILTEEFGEDIANQPEFERISAEVWRMIEEDNALRQQLGDAIDQLGRHA